MSPAFYQPFYLIVIALVSIYAVNQVTTIKKLIGNSNSDEVTALVLTIATILFIGFRDPRSEYFGDTGTYTRNYLLLFGTDFTWDWSQDDALFNNILQLFASQSIDIELFYTLIAALYFGLAYAACRKWFPNNTLLAMTAWMAAFSTFSYGTNGIRAGLAASVFLFALANKENRPFLGSMMVASWAIHHSMFVPITAFVCVFFVRNSKYYFALWLLSFAIAAAHITAFQSLFASYSDDTGAGYLLANKNNADSYLTGFRLDFILYSAMPVLVGYFMIFRYGVQDATYRLLLNLYLLTNSVWMLAMYASFSNRIAYLSWFLYPVVLIYPFLKIHFDDRNHLRWFRYVFYGHLCFTLFMTFIYYA